MALQLSEIELRRELRFFGYFQLAGALYVAACLLYNLTYANYSARTGLNGLMHLLLLALSSFVGYCGFATLRNPAQGLRWAVCSQLLQFFGFALGGYGLQFFAQPSIVFNLNLTSDTILNLNFTLGEAAYALHSANPEMSLSFNLTAALLLWRISVWQREWTGRYA